MGHGHAPRWRLHFTLFARSIGRIYDKLGFYHTPTCGVCYTWCDLFWVEKQLRQFFALRVRDDVEKLLSFRAPSLHTRNMKTISKVCKQDTLCSYSLRFISQVLKRIRKANQGDIQSFQHLLGLAYGRKGKLKWELLEVCDYFSCVLGVSWLKTTKPFMYSNGPLPDTIIPGRESSRPPTFSPELTTLLTSPHSRTTRPLNKGDIITPRNLPACADPLSEDARIYGQFSKRREVNIRWRQFRAETKKLFPPLDSSVADIVHAKLENVECAVGSLFRGPTKTRRERKDNVERDESPIQLVRRHPSRWVRRRYRWLLSHSPRLVNRSGNFLGVQISSRSFSPYQKSAAYIPEVDGTTLTWFRRLIVIKSHNSG